MCLYKFTHILLLKSDALLKKKKSDKKSNHPNLLGKKNHVKRKNKKKKKSKRKEKRKKKRKKKKKKSNEAFLGNQKKKKKSNGMDKPCASSHEHFCHLFIKLLPLGFLSILERIHFGGPGEKTPGLHQFFSLLSLQPNTHQKSFYSYFHLAFIREGGAIWAELIGHIPHTYMYINLKFLIVLIVKTI